MDRAADGLVASGAALTAIYNAVAQGLPEALVRADRVLALGERGVVALERLADTSAPAGDHCTRCGQRVDLHDDGVACRPD
jgi:hypothetical protein